MWKCGQFLKIVKKSFYLDHTIGARRGAVDSVKTRIMSGWSKFWHLVPLLTSIDLPLGDEGRLYYTCVCSFTLYEKETWSVKEKDMIRLERDDAR